MTYFSLEALTYRNRAGKKSFDFSANDLILYTVPSEKWFSS
jgi:hypothetical protein